MKTRNILKMGQHEVIEAVNGENGLNKMIEKELS